MNILDKIVAHKRVEVARQKELVSIDRLEAAERFGRQTVSLASSIRAVGKNGIIAEFKRRSPSRGVINAQVSPEEVTRGYAAAGASGLSVLTDEEFFGGKSADLILARQHNDIPILRKDFTVDEYQIIEAKAIGADAVLLIAAVLTPVESKRLVSLAHSLGLEVLMEVHDEEELRANLEVGADLIGVNNRNLKTFEVSTDVSKRLAPLIPDGVVKVSESGISSIEAIQDLKSFGYEGFLIGENFMKSDDPVKAASEFMMKLATK
jgi:indole-3-glycerol phosphate synthase